MNENKDSRRPVGLVLLLIYQWILVMGSLTYAATVEIWTNPPRDWGDWLAVVFFLVLACWGIAMGVASVGIMRRSPRGFLVGMICHLLLEILALPQMLFLGFLGIVGALSEPAQGFGEISQIAETITAILFALICLPFVLISGWAFFYLRKLRKSLFAQIPGTSPA